mmetsp:Transcript_12375/g.27500  ORF Transcript_12375/g.27500 Transcript_12375/m.27500 type:complete len:312 (-) Transcript_12375:298-1233(-)
MLPGDAQLASCVTITLELAESPKSTGTSAFSSTTRSNCSTAPSPPCQVEGCSNCPKETSSLEAKLLKQTSALTSHGEGSLPGLALQKGRLAVRKEACRAGRGAEELASTSVQGGCRWHKSCRTRICCNRRRNSVRNIVQAEAIASRSCVVCVSIWRLCARAASNWYSSAMPSLQLCSYSARRSSFRRLSSEIFSAWRRRSFARCAFIASVAICAPAFLRPTTCVLLPTELDVLMDSRSCHSSTNSPLLSSTASISAFKRCPSSVASSTAVSICCVWRWSASKSARLAALSWKARCFLSSLSAASTSKARLL